MSEENNREGWNKDSDAYQSAHGAFLRATPMAWGVWRVPEADLRVLGDVVNAEILELGCGAAQWALALARSGARPVGIDLSERQLDHARQACIEGGVAAPLVQGTAESLPFNSESFDIVFCDHGATAFAPPETVIPEASRVLRPGGLLAFCMSSPIRDICWDTAGDRLSTTLRQDYFSLHVIEDADETCYQLPYGSWIRLFRANLLNVEDLIELKPPENAATTYKDFVPFDWARRWPAENIWKLRKSTV